MDTQITTTMISTVGTFLGGVVTAFGGSKLVHRKRVTQDQRCERICASMVGMSETLLAVIEAIGANDHRLAPYIAQLEVRVSDARAFLEQSKDKD